MQISLTTLQSMQPLEQCSIEPEPHVVRICYTEGGNDWCYDLPEKPVGGLNSYRISQFLTEFEYAFNRRLKDEKPFYSDLREKTAHVAWLQAHADALEREARMSRLFASRIGNIMAA